MLVSGLLKIHWNLKQAIQLSAVNEESSGLPPVFNAKQSEQHTDFKATLIRDSYSQRQSSLDDSSLNKKKVNKNFNENEAHSARAQTVKCKPNKWKRPSLNQEIMKENEVSQSNNFL